MHPPEFTIRKIGPQDLVIFQKLILLLLENFNMEIPPAASESYLKDLLARPEFIVYVAMQGNEPIGGLTAYELPMYYSGYSEVYIYDIAVIPEFLRKGIGTQLISSLNEYCRQHGIKEIFVDADERDEHAVRFYQATGGEAMKVIHFTYPVR
jgi:aminoglycoside 3-N-acetyltransferase I